MVRAAKDWPWSSYRGTAGLSDAHACLTKDWILGCFGRQRKKTQQHYRNFIQQGRNQLSPWENLKNQIYLASGEFVEDMQCRLDPDQSLEDIPKLQKQTAIKPLAYFHAM
ncbi:MAG: hypothetical protein KAG18_06905 [Sinobacterium sp.]|nr:hypothetical protein [Sinobacterium sp.]